ncbi:MAG: RNA methyltransferase [Methylococcaceae bacterium]|nr:RNA methyltransferase [Methylococcaceae bacterium]
MSSTRHPKNRLPASPPHTRAPQVTGSDAGSRPTTALIRVAGLSAVSALFRKSPERVVRLFYEDRRVPDVGGFCATLAGLRRPYRKVEGEELVKIAGTVLHGGVVAVAEPQPERPLSVEESRHLAQAHQTLFILDGIGNPHNLGAIARTLAFFGFRHLALSDHPLQAGLSDAAYRIAEGGLDCLSIHRIRALPDLMRQIRPLYRTLGTALGSRGQPLESLKAEQRPVAVILGNEETGLPSATLAACERVVTLSGRGNVQSLNVAATAAIIAYALRPGDTARGRGRQG